MASNYKDLADGLTRLLGLSTPPIAIAFCDGEPEDVVPYGGTYPAPTAGGRTGAVPAGCAFWMKAPWSTFSTTAEDHGNCSVGSLTHGFRTLDEVAGNEDVAALVGAEWVNPEMFPVIPTVAKRPSHVVYGPLADAPVTPDVVFLQIDARQAMLLHDACPDLRIEGKPQCHIVPIAKEQDQIAISVGCMLSRVRTGMSKHTMTCAIPAGRGEDVVRALEQASAADRKVAAYAASDAKRFD